MIQKFISILLIFSVNAFLLAQAVLPHHHHNGIPHFAFSQLEEHQHTQDSCCCSHHNEHEEDFCLFDKEVDVLYKSENHHCYCTCCVEHLGISGSLLTAVLFSFTYDVSAHRQQTPLITRPYLISYNQSPVISSTGLRAPPMS